jgi:hypothetical protein
MPIRNVMIETLEPRMLLCGHTPANPASMVSAGRASAESPLIMHVSAASGKAILSPIVMTSALGGPPVAGAVLNALETVDLANSGTAVARGAVIVNIFASADGTVDDSSFLLATTKRQVKISPNRTLVLRLKIRSLPSSMAPATYTLLAQAIDSSGGTSDAASGPTVQVAAPFVSLSAVVNGISPTAIAPGKSGTATVTIANRGNIAADGNAVINVGLSVDGQSASLRAVHQKLKIKPGGVAKLRLKFAVPKSQAAGNYFAFFSITQNGQQARAVGTSRFTID